MEHDYSVTDISKHLRASAQSLYKWVKVAMSSDENKDKLELAEVSLSWIKDS